MECPQVRDVVCTSAFNLKRFAYIVRRPLKDGILLEHLYFKRRLTSIFFCNMYIYISSRSIAFLILEARGNLLYFVQG
jgi:hypothetical protein